MKSSQRILALCTMLALCLSLLGGFASATEPENNVLKLISEVESSLKMEEVLDRYNVVWNTQSGSSSGSMPVGGGDIGLNVWMENNSLYFYIGKSDTFDENNMLAKVGRVKIDLEPNPFAEGTAFRQELKLKEGYCEISGTGKDGNTVQIKVWVDVFNPVIHVEVESKEPVSVTAEYQSWRLTERTSGGTGLNEITDYWNYPGTFKLYPDVTKFETEDTVLFYHKNNKETQFMNLAIEQQGLKDKINMDAWYDPVTDFTFGGLMQGEGMSKAGEPTTGKYNNYDYRAWAIRSKGPKTTQSVDIALATGQYETVELWRTALQRNLDAKISHQTSVDWWRDFWARSYVAVNQEKTEADKGFEIGRNYQLFRYMLGCNAYGKYPSKFNGGMFTWDSGGNPDYRKWGGAGMTAQNQRHIYWPMLKSGDYDMMKPQFDFYNNGYQNNEQAVKSYWGHEGTMFNEYPTYYGLSTGGMYGWPSQRFDANGKVLDVGVTWEPYTHLEYVHQLDFATMMLEQQRYSGEDLSQYVGFIESATRFYLEHYKYRYKEYTRAVGKEDEDGYDEKGKLVIYPSRAVETYWNVKNPNDVIVALHTVLDGLLRLYEEGYTSIDVQTWKDMKNRLPELTIGTKENGDQYFLPGQHPGAMGAANPIYKNPSYWKGNCEAPQLSVVYPFNRISQGREGAQLAVNTISTLGGDQMASTSWQYMNIVTARLGMVNEAKNYAVQKLGNGGVRFPAFFGPGHDWIPDHNWGGTGMGGLQEMAMQAYDDVIQPYACWPSDWRGQYKLYAPEQTIVEGFETADGNRVVKLSVEADSTRQRVVLNMVNASFAKIVDGAGNPVATSVTDHDTVVIAVAPGKCYYVVPTLSIPDETLSARRLDDTTVRLMWKQLPEDYTYNVYRRSLVQGVPTERIATGLTTAAFIDQNADVIDAPYYYAVSLNSADGEGVRTAECKVTNLTDIAYYSFDNPAHLGEETVNKEHANQVGTVSSEERDGGYALKLDGNGYLSIPNSENFSLTSDMTIEVMVKPTAYGSYLRILNKITAGASDGFLIDLSPEGKIRTIAGSMFPGEGWFLSNGIIPLNEWTAIKFEINEENKLAKLYLNGELDAEKEISGTLPLSGADLRIGADSAGGSKFMGSIDELSLKGVTPEKIPADLPGDLPEGILAYYNFQTAKTERLYDLTNYRNHAAVNGTPKLVSGVSGQAVAFENGVYAKISDANPLRFTNNVAVEIAVNPGAAYTAGVILDQTVEDRGICVSMLEDGKIRAKFAGTTLTSATSAALSDWTTVCVTYSNGTMRLAVGSDVQEMDVTEKLPITRAPLMIAANQDGTDGFAGALDELKIYPAYLPDEGPTTYIMSADHTAMAEGLTAQLRVIAQAENGDQTDVTSQATFDAENKAVCTVTAGGEVTAVGSGETKITATIEGQTQSLVFAVVENTKYQMYLSDLQGTTVSDLSGNSQGAVAHADVQETKGVLNGQAMLFSGGANEEVTAPGLKKPIDQFALELWVRPDVLSGERAFLDAHTGANNYNGLFMDVNSGGVIRVLGGATGLPNPNHYIKLSSTDTIAAKQWSHLKVTVDTTQTGQELTLYMNGKMAGSQSFAAPIPAGTGTMALGARRDMTSNFIGALDEFKMYAYDAETAPTLASAELQIASTDDLRAPQTIKFRVLGNLSDGTTVDLTPIAELRDSVVGGMTTDQYGNLTINKVGAHEIAATIWYDGETATSDAVEVVVDQAISCPIAVSVEGEGTVSPDGATVNVVKGDNQTLAVTPNSDQYKIEQLLIDGTDCPVDPNGAKYTFKNVQRAHTVEVFFAPKQSVTIAGVQAAEKLEYNRLAQQGYTGTPTSEYTGPYQYLYAGAGYRSDKAPTNAGDYSLTISVPAEDCYYTGSTTLNFSIGQKALTAKPRNDTILTGDELPTDWSMEYVGKLFGDTIAESGETPIFVLQKDDATALNSSATPGTYPIVWINKDAVTLSNGNYAITKADGVLQIKAKSSGGGTGSTQFTITAKPSDGGVINPASGQVKKGESRTFTIKANEGYVIKDVLVDGKSVGAVSSYTFSNVTANHTITAVFEKLGSTGFVDVKDADWFADKVKWAVDEGIMKGVSEGKFDPNGKATRAMILTMLYRQAGSPKATGRDVWYADAQKWAMTEGISDGTNLTGEITREQLVTMLWRANGSPKADTKKFDGFTDGATVSDYAKEAVAWAVERGILTGKGQNNLDPAGHATRAETATMFMRLTSLL